MFILLTHSSENGRFGRSPKPSTAKSRFSRLLRDLRFVSKLAVLPRYSRIFRIGSYSFELQDSVFGSLPFSEFRRFGRFKRIRPKTDGDTEFDSVTLGRYLIKRLIVHLFSKIR